MDAHDEGLVDAGVATGTGVAAGTGVTADTGVAAGVAVGVAAGVAAGVAVLHDPDRAALLLDPDRRRLLAALREAPDSASGLARRLGEARQRLNYHLRLLEEAGLIELHDERPRRGFVERVMRPSAGHFLIDPSAADEGAAQTPTPGPAAGDRFSATHLIAVAARTVREVAVLRERAEGEGKRLATAGMDARVRLASPAEFHDFTEALARAVAEVVARFDRDEAGARAFRVMAGSHPAPPEQDEGGAS